MRYAGLAGWPLWLSVGLHVVGLAGALSVIALARRERVLVPVEIVRVEPPPPVPEPPRPRRVDPRPSPVVRKAPITQTLMQPDPAPGPGRRSEPVPTAPDRRYMASANVPGPALAVPRHQDAGGLEHARSPGLRAERPLERREVVHARHHPPRRWARLVQPGRGTRAPQRSARGAPGLRAGGPPRRDARAGAEGSGEGARGHEGAEPRPRARPGDGQRRARPAKKCQKTDAPCQGSSGRGAVPSCHSSSLGQ